ncbi:hypothetical protein O181_074629 [Austropuccinia psidii MF-1]|uniref:Uncharacterized protein n=1 Tax=Austropuccinia psidii MF-1 TaxID=1389203 RepID=A0A9Q3F8Y3_9BASI|nr:hypothetical protein [Austropuccinia psidii MF-1]
MEDARTSTSTQRLARTFDTLIESPEADITAIPVVRPESFPTGNNRTIPVSIQELVYGSKAAGVGTSSKSLDRHNKLISSSEEVHGPRKYRGFFEGFDTHVLQRTTPKDKTLVENPKHVFKGSEEEFGPRRGGQPSGSSPSLLKQNPASKSANQGKATPKEQSEGKAEGKRKGKALPTELQNLQEREEIHGQCVKYGKKSDGIQKQGGGKNEPILFKEIKLLKIVNHFETFNKEILAKLDNSEYIQQTFCREILQVK